MDRERKRVRKEKAQQAARQKQAIARQTVVSKLRAKGFSDAQITAHLGEADD